MKNLIDPKPGSIKSIFFKINWIIYFLLSLLAFIGGLILYSVSQGNFYPLASSHLFKYLISSIALIITCLLSINFIYKTSYIFYFFSIILLILVLILGNENFGSNRWLIVWGVTFQPSELSKVAVILALARYYHDYYLISNNNIIKVIFPILILIIPFGFVINQPDLGTALLILISALAVIFLSGIGIWYIFFSTIFFTALAPFLWNLLYDYQKKRILTFLNPEQDPLGSGYHIAQSKIAIGSGGFLGKGYIQGSQSHLEFIPEMHTDFVFSIYSEEFGFLGSVILILIYFYVLCYGVISSYRAKSTFARLIIAGLTVNIFLYFIVNISMVIGVIPVVGVPLPLVSYGGSAMLVTMISFGLIMNLNNFKEQLN
ncbi:MAG: rod shape-determining protein RodA [Pelagibacterales bacterium]|nr:rod shape-determining protein RodA [Pelagibacterales bacterium]|tara:strand:+ start:4036 stop:5154 length:1119 start_codon:yes stop_codon:yes gene_type:complete